MDFVNNTSQIVKFEKIYNDNKNIIYTYLLSLLNYNQEEASQLLSDTFVKLREYYKKNKIENPRNLLYSIAHNIAVDYIKKNQNTTYINPKRDKWYDDTIENANIEISKEHIKNFISNLDHTSKEIFQLTYYEEKSYQEISEILKIPKNTVWTILFQIKNKLKKYFINAK